MKCPECGKEFRFWQYYKMLEHRENEHGVSYV